ncbi:hypothetical protein Bhyg_05151 [Pseudolycoriella hygida]|uniref:Uncharacterized protein n=1 Tax=Pseudolycoriella hygida TaxID=35572 RepID=A0A9Q0SAH8_9DIPT|nr:hypothetical protein Bhyg_05151 [Pseudolycoriella hygida]
MCILDIVDGSENGLSIRHPESGGECLTVDGNYSGNKGYTSPCEYTFGLTPVYQRFRVLGGTVSGSNKFQSYYKWFATCIYTGSNYNDPVYTTSCDDSDGGNLSFRALAVTDRHPRVLIQQVSIDRCLRKDGGDIRAVDCNEHDVQQHWIACKAGDRGCEPVNEMAGKTDDPVNEGLDLM